MADTAPKMAEDRSTHDWMFRKAPAPSRFERSSSRRCGGKVSSMDPTKIRDVNSTKVRRVAGGVAKEIPTTLAVGDDLWAFTSNTHPKNAQAMFYAAHRKYVAQELRLSCAQDVMGCDTGDWDQLLVALSLEK